MLQAENGRRQATAELAEREQALADARTNVERVKRHEADGNPQPATAEPAAQEEEMANPRQRIDRVEGTDAGGLSPLKAGCAVAGLAGIGLITAAMLALTVDTQHVTIAGIVGAISAGGMFAVLWVGFVANWYRKHTMPVQDETAAASKGSSPKPRASKG
jgi:uncharacterized protein (DUF2345 family)